MEIPCVLVTSRRKLSGRLAIIKKSLHFFAESCVEGAGGSPVLKPEHSGGPQRQKFLKWPMNLNGGSERLSHSDNFDMVIGNKYQKQHISTKRHRWWNILDVLIPFCASCFLLSSRLCGYNLIATCSL